MKKVILFSAYSLHFLALCPGCAIHYPVTKNVSRKNESLSLMQTWPSILTTPRLPMKPIFTENF